MKKIASIAVFSAGLIMLAFLIKTVFFYKAIYRPKQTGAQAVKKEPKTAYNILLLGYGGEGHDGAYLTDTMIVLHLNIKRKLATLISIPRDIWVQLPTESGQPYGAKINTVFQIERFPTTFPDVTAQGLTKSMVTSITGLPIDNYVTVDFDGFKKSIDIIGGVNINVARAFTDKEYPVDGMEKDLCGKTEADLPELEKIATQSPVLAFPCRYETLAFSAGPQEMDAVRALKYVRSRHGDADGGDFGRAARQQLFLEAVREKVVSVGFIPKILPLMNELQDDIETDIDPALIQQFIGELSRSDSYRVNKVVLSNNDYLDFGRSSDGQSILMPKAGMNKWSEVHAWIEEEITATATPSAVAQ